MYLLGNLGADVLQGQELQGLEGLQNLCPRIPWQLCHCRKKNPDWVKPAYVPTGNPRGRPKKTKEWYCSQTVGQANLTKYVSIRLLCYSGIDIRRRHYYLVNQDSSNRHSFLPLLERGWLQLIRWLWTEQLRYTRRKRWAATSYWDPTRSNRWGIKIWLFLFKEFERI